MIVVTGAAGFIGYHVARALLERGEAVLGIDNVNAYYDPSLKEARLALLREFPRFRFERIDIVDRAAVSDLIRSSAPSRVVHLAAQAGVRYSLTNPHAYVDSNVTGFLNLLEAARSTPVQHMVYASSSSVYGGTQDIPFSLADRADQPVSLYAATKRANELMAYVYARQFQVPLTGLRFFTVYGPWGRPDMAPMKFTRAILAGEAIDVYNHGDMRRDFTYIDDVTSAVLRILDKLPPPDRDGIQHRVYNVGNHQAEPLMRFIEVLSKAIGRSPQMNMLPMQPGDVPATYADISETQRDYAWEPTTAIDAGIPRFVDWYRRYFKT